MEPRDPRLPVRFGVFELHPTAIELRRGARRVRLERRPMELLMLLVERARAEDGWLRIASRLIRVHDPLVLWSAAYDRQAINVLRLQRKLCRAIADEIRVRLAPERLAPPGRRQTHHLDAHDFYLRGRLAWNHLTR